ncbi:hypothetical protein [Spirosoma agri]|uniref:Uncharacterized protein n=1 Tax=Spirosoma agri TaxID=1987381 RepID=A0A6M0IJ71_9BACT|nr:hypothetical protein [Spirosoma agri]NEU67877.1 hypothetical protein [Spirosoma agri]
MVNYLIGVGILCQLLLMVNYGQRAAEKESTMRDRIEYIAIALVYGAMGTILVIGMIKYSLFQGQK